MASPAVRSFVFAVEFRIAESERVGPVLARHEESLRDLGARYAFVYESIVEAGRVLVVIGVRSEQPLLNLLRSPNFFEWFDAVGVDDLPAVFAGETVERFDLGEPPTPGTEVVVAAVTRVEDVEVFLARVRESLGDFARSGIRRTLVYRAFDTPREVLFLQQLTSARTALQWVARSDITAEWLASAGVGAYPPVFVGRFVHAMRLAETAGTDLH
ncbi:fatty-acid--CoA ligase [Mycobacterium deserti]|uniref:Fatty-acid--CoA ligase n=1 Tax=Mycobacterium deserti TaxID=2978347 RepID=A0ABT2MFV6_9MYCO|nr:fatty-acid--CoA ligase [Mycobacterium deserti]MCT7661174.1 fatty-acid--CoA ligase [Mycobacterium deserti]